VSEFRDAKHDYKVKLHQLESELHMTKNINSQQTDRLNKLEEEVAEFRTRDAKEKALREVLELKEVRIRDLELELSSVRESLNIQRQSASASSANSRMVHELQEQLSVSKDLLKGKLLLEEKVATLRDQANKADLLIEKVATMEQQIKASFRENFMILSSYS
jgi:hypothetical protein